MSVRYGIWPGSLQMLGCNYPDMYGNNWGSSDQSGSSQGVSWNWILKPLTIADKFKLTTGPDQAFDPIVWVGKSAVNQSDNPLAYPQPYSVFVFHPDSFILHCVHDLGHTRPVHFFQRLSHLAGLGAQFPLWPLMLYKNACAQVRGSLATNIHQTLLLCNHMPSFQAAGNTENLLLFVSLPPSLPPPALLCHRVSIRLSLRLSCDPSIISISPWCAVLFRLIASPAPCPLCTPRPSPFSPLCISLPLFVSFNTPSTCTPPTHTHPQLHRATSPWLHPFSPTATPSFTPCPSSCHHASCHFLSVCHILLLAGHS